MFAWTGFLQVTMVLLVALHVRVALYVLVAACPTQETNG